jgi:hypothetical protein
MQWPHALWHAVIEAPWLVNGGHGASLRHHNERTQQRTSRTLSVLSMADTSTRRTGRPQSKTAAFV